jgi:NitT/TauT family transport system permease protein
LLEAFHLGRRVEDFLDLGNTACAGVFLDDNGPGRRTMTGKSNRFLPYLYPLALVAAMIGVWALICATGAFHPSAFPTPAAVFRAFREEIVTGRLATDVIVSLFRVSCGFLLAVALGVPVGVWLGQQIAPRMALLPLANFFRNLSPLAWIPFAILWFGVGDASTIFLIVLAAFFPVVISTMAAVSSIPTVYLRVAHDYGLRGTDKLIHVTLPAVMPQVITTLRVTAGLSWLVVVAAEMVAGREGLGFAVMDARNGLRTDLLLVEMIAIGLIGVAIDAVLMRLTKIPNVRWGYER